MSMQPNDGWQEFDNDRKNETMSAYYERVKPILDALEVSAPTDDDSELAQLRMFAKYVTRYIQLSREGCLPNQQTLDNIWYVLQELHPYIPEVE